MIKPLLIVATVVLAVMTIASLPEIRTIIPILPFVLVWIVVKGQSAFTFKLLMTTLVTVIYVGLTGDTKTAVVLAGGAIAFLVMQPEGKQEYASLIGLVVLFLSLELLASGVRLDTTSLSVFGIRLVVLAAAVVFTARKGVLA